TDGVFSGNVTIGGTLTYEDVINVDSVGIITARDGIDCNGDLDVDGHTNLDNVSIAGVTTITNAYGYLYLEGLAPSVYFKDTSSGTPTFRLMGEGGSFYVQNTTNPSNSLIINTATKQATFGGGVDVGGDLDVDGHTNLDNVSIAGFTTITQDLDVDGHTNLDNVSVAGVTTFSDDVKFTGANYNVLWDKSDNSLKFDALAKIKLNDSFQFYHNTNGVLHNTSGTTYIYGSGSGNISIQAQVGAQNISCGPNSNTSLYYAGGQKLYTVSDGVYINDNL
ncbi:MAG: hypothetical protein VXY93_13985, partial [Pseudomonadota bacterium]|nr:hypothetical protein [Pseudomonadota bacterium]